MKFFILMMIVSATLANLNLLAKLAPFAKSLQESCVDYSPQFSVHKESMNALVCGTAIKNSVIKDSFITTELFHLLVVSGSHLQTLLWALDRGPTRFRRLGFFMKWLFLVSYVLMTGLGAPVVRALFAELLRSLSAFFRWHWSAWKVQVTSGFILLALNIEYFYSFSFYLSWLASLGFLWPLPKESSSLQKHFLICLTISLLMLIPFTYRGPLGLLMNFLFAGVLSFGLFPLAFLTKLIFCCGWDVSFIFDGIFAGLLSVLAFAQTLGLSQSLQKTVFPDLGWQMWALLLAVQLSLFWLRHRRRRLSPLQINQG